MGATRQLLVLALLVALAVGKPSASRKKMLHKQNSKSMRDKHEEEGQAPRKSREGLTQNRLKGQAPRRRSEDLGRLQMEVSDNIVQRHEADHYEFNEGPLTHSERGAIIGSVLLSAAGIPGLLVGGALGGAAGVVAERFEHARAYVAEAYGARVEVEQRNAAEIAAAHEELNALADVTVSCEDAEEAEALKQAMIRFLLCPSNMKCADCAAKISHRNEAWASVNLGVIVCFECAAVHRSLGVSVSRIKSVVFDRWDAQSTRALVEAGNDRARALYLANLPRGYREPTEDSDAAKRAQFIQTKYVRMRWAEPSFREQALASRKSAQGPKRTAVVQRQQTATPSSGPKKSSKQRGQRSAQAPLMPSLSSETM